MKLKPKKSEQTEPKAAKPVSKGSPNPNRGTVPDVRPVAIARLQDTDDWYTVFQLRRHDDRTAYMAMPSGDASQERAVSSALRNAGTAGGNHFSFPNLVKRLTMASAPADGMIIIRGGWDEASKCFALPDKMLGGDTAGSVSPKFICLDFNWKKRSQLVVRDGSPGVSQLNISRRGSTEAWQTKVATPALKSSFMMSAVCAAFGAPLLKLLGMPPFTIALTGETTSGKTTATVVGGSVIGFGADQLPTWNITAAGLEQRAEIHFDVLLPIDDLNSAPGSEKEKFQLINGVAYRITGGAVRHTLTTAKSSITGRPPIKGPIRTIIFTSAEDSMADIAATAKMNLPGGFYSRLIEIPVPKPKNGGVFDLANFEGSRSKRVKAARKLSKKIASACGKNHGFVFRKYVEAIIKDPAMAVQTVSAAREKFLKVVDIDRSEAMQWRRAEVFAFLYGAGVYAIKLKLLPWTVAQLSEALQKCLAASWTALPKSTNMLEAGLERLRGHLRRRDRIVAASAVKNLKAIDGWWETAGGNKTYMVLGKRFRGLFASSAQRLRVEKYLKKKGVLIPGAKGKPTKQPLLPGTSKKAARCYELRVPADACPSVLFPRSKPPAANGGKAKESPQAAKKKLPKRKGKAA